MAIEILGDILIFCAFFPPLSLSLDYVYFENSSSNPYLIRRIEELNKVGRSTLLLGHGGVIRVWSNLLAEVKLP